MVLDHGGGHHVVGPEPQAVGQVVDGLGGVAHQDDDVVARPAPARRSGTRCRGPPRRPRWRGGTCSPAPRCTLEYQGRNSCDPVGHRLQRRGRRRAVEIAVGPVDTVETGHRRVGPDERREFGLRGHAVTLGVRTDAVTRDRRTAPGWRAVPALPCPCVEERYESDLARSGGRARRRRPRARAPERGHLRARARPAARRSSTPTSSADPTRRVCEQHLALARTSSPTPTRHPGHRAAAARPAVSRRSVSVPWPTSSRAATSDQLTTFHRAAKKSAFTFLYCR